MVTALSLAQEKSKAGTLTDESKKQMYDLYKSNLATSGSKETALAQTQDKLASATIPTSTTPVTPKPVVSKPVESSSLQGTLGYTSDQVPIPGVNKVEPPKPTTPTDTSSSKTLKTGTITTEMTDAGVKPVEPKPVEPTGTPTGTPTGVPLPEETQKQLNSIIDTMFPKGTYSDEERKAIYDAMSSKNSQELLDFMQKGAEDQYKESQELLNAYRTTRDFAIQGEREKQLNDRRLKDMKQAYDNAINTQKQRIENDANNMAVVQGTAGRLQSRNLVNAVSQVLDNNKRVYDELVSNKDRDIQRLAEDLEYAQKIASNEYNDAISEQMQAMLSKIKSLDDTGALNSAEGLKQARSFLETTIQNNMQHQVDYYNKLSYISQRFDTYKQEALAMSQVDDKVTSAMNDGYLYNAYGTRVKDENGTPIKVQGSTAGTLLTKEPIVLTDGTKAFIYQNTDGTTRVEKIAGTEAIQLDETLKQKYAQALQSGLLEVDDLLKIGIPQQTINDIMAGVTPQTKVDFKEFGGNLYATDEQGNISLAITGEPKKTEWKKLDDGTYIDPEGNIVTADELKQQKILENKFLNAEVGTNVGVECGVFASRAVGMTSTPGGNKLEDRIKEFNSTDIIPGGMVLFTGGGYDKTYGHIAVVTGVNVENGTFEVTESNFNNDKKVTKRTISLDDPTITGFYNKTPLIGGEDKPLTDKEFTQSNQIITSFKADPQVKAFEEAYSQGLSLLSSLNDKSGPGDVSAIFQFMKTLDPASVVRESEFEVAAKSAGVSAYLGNTWDRLSKGEKLTDSQRQAFGKLAMQFINDKAKLYDTKYQDGLNRLQKQGIDTSIYPASIADQMRDYLSGNQETENSTPKVTASNGKTYGDYFNSSTAPTKAYGDYFSNK